MRISDWSSDVRSSDLPLTDGTQGLDQKLGQRGLERAKALAGIFSAYRIGGAARKRAINADQIGGLRSSRSEEHTSELQSLMRSSYAVFCLKKKKSGNAERSAQQNNHTKYKYHRL